LSTYKEATKLCKNKKSGEKLFRIDGVPGLFYCGGRSKILRADGGNVPTGATLAKYRDESYGFFFPAKATMNALEAAGFMLPSPPVTEKKPDDELQCGCGDYVVEEEHADVSEEFLQKVRDYTRQLDEVRKKAMARVDASPMKMSQEFDLDAAIGGDLP